MQIVIDITDSRYNEIMTDDIYIDVPIFKEDIIATIPEGHGRIVDIGKIDKDKIESDNPIISLTINGEYIEAVSLDYLNNLPTIIEAESEG